MGLAADGAMKYFQQVRKVSLTVNPAAHRHVGRLALSLAWMSVAAAFCQTTPASNQGSPTAGGASRADPVAVPVPAAPSPTEQLPKRIFWIIPNYRSYPSLKDSKPLTTGAKFKIAARDSFDPGTLLLAGAFAGGA